LNPPLHSKRLVAGVKFTEWKYAAVSGNSALVVTRRYFYLSCRVLVGIIV